MTQIKCKNLCLGYGNNIVVKDLSFSVSAGEYVCVTGSNGSGKSTLIKTILGLKSPISGSVEFCEGFTKNQIGYLPQQTDFQKDFPASVREIVLSGFQGKCGLRPYYNKTEKDFAKQAMSKMNILALSKKCYRELSGGQQQRVLLARALCAAGKMLILDEPVSGLDPVASSEMYNVINDLNKNDKVTIIMISHDIEAVKKYSDKIINL